MQSTATATLSLIPVTTTPAATLEKLQTPAIAADNAAESAGLFASLLSELTLDDTIVVPEATALAPTLAPVIAAELLPVGGNDLPLPTQLLSADVDAPVVIDNLIADAILPDEGLPDAGLPVLVPIKPLTHELTVTSQGPAPVIAATVAKPVLDKPLTQSKPVTADRLRLATVTEPLTITDAQPTQAPATIKDMPVEFALPSNNPMTQNIAADSSNLLMTTAGTTTSITQTSTTATTIATTTTTPQASMTLNHPVSDARWGESLGQRLMWMTDNGMGRAEIRLNPPELGPLNVKLSVANDEAKVAFTVQHGTTRELVEAALPRLREMFASQGIELTDANVSQHSADDQRQAQHMDDSQQGSTHDNTQALSAADETDTIAGSSIIREGLIDTYV